MDKGEVWLAKNRNPRERTAGDRLAYGMVVVLGAAIVCALFVWACNSLFL